MKLHLLLAFGLAVTGCRQEAPHPEVLARLKALEAEVAKQRPTPVRWAIASRTELRNAIYARAREKLEELKRADALPPEQEAKVAHYESLNWQLITRPRPPSVTSPPAPSSLRPVRTVPDALPPLPPRELSGGLAPLPLPGSSVSPPTPPPVPPAPSAEAKDYEALVKRVAEAKAPVAKVVERRAEITAKYHSTKFLEQLVADYVKQKEHYDVVVDASNESSFSRPILYRTSAEVPDITAGILQFFREREKP